MILLCAEGKRTERLWLICQPIAPLICSLDERLKPFLSGLWSIPEWNSSAEIVRASICEEQRKELRWLSKCLIATMFSPMCARWGSRIVSRHHATLKQRQKDAGVIVRARYKKKRSSSEIAASQVARLRRQAWYEEVVEHYRQGKSIAARALVTPDEPDDGSQVHLRGSLS